MRKRQWLIVTLALSFGVILGMSTLVLATDPSAPAVLLARVGLINGAAAKTPSSGATASADTNRTSPAAAGVLPGSDQANSGQGSSAGADAGPADAGQATGVQADSAPGSAGGAAVVPASVAEAVVTDYKRDIGSLFDAWKSPDMQTFRSKLAEGYAGDLFERHARRAEEYLTQGVGLYVSALGFDQVIVEKADAVTATLRADYHYTAQDYSLAEATPFGEKTEHQVHVRVNLVKMNQHWLIVGETLLNG